MKITKRSDHIRFAFKQKFIFDLNLPSSYEYTYDVIGFGRKWFGFLRR